MPPLCPQDCVSLSPTFVDPVSIEVYSHTARTMRDDFEFYAGLLPGEFTRISKMPIYHISLQPSLALAFSSFEIAFKAPDMVLKAVYDLYVSNSQCRLEDRTRFDSVEWPSISGSSLLLDEEIRIVYTKHPVTGEVTTHTHPFPHLPKFTISAAHPALLTLQATKFRLYNQCNPLDMLTQMFLMRSTYTPHPSFYKDWSAYWREDPAGSSASTAVSSMKRKALGNANIYHKRPRKSSDDVDAKKASPQRGQERRPVHDVRRTEKMHTSPRRSTCPLDSR
ncbi:hypothetical protein CYLTODRAFT_223873 [Cylindrobasidium torrendii FP15055 ss-10]|uniref:Uncharacterized protein n=1 Tax=Cylindrobasidium torrendii FP15055 ss-10 TaxID=1314674 RepID=A0A0D7BGK3_9AGAR|nr:hypothetical protein CYLTODRAFT_223873 [Cylindrobasidium torrendii FP15055 ss-10]